MYVDEIFPLLKRVYKFVKLQAKTPADAKFSHHVTLSTYQRNTWADLLTAGVRAAIDNARDEGVLCFFKQN